MSAGERASRKNAAAVPRPARSTMVAMSNIVLPSGTTAKWYGYTRTADKAKLRAALEGVSLIEAPSAQDEAEVVALILREAAETPGRTAALISPDRLLARRVAIRLEAWGIRVDDSAGKEVATTIYSIHQGRVGLTSHMGRPFTGHLFHTRNWLW